MSTIKIYGFAPSTYTQTAVAVAREVGARFELVPLQFKTPSHLARHPHGKMPALEDGDVSLYETMAIIGYLDEVYGDGRLTPRSPIERAQMLQGISVGIDYAYPALVGSLHDEEPDAEAVGAAAEQLKLLDVALAAGPYFAGGTLSLADFFLRPMVAFAVAKMGSPKLEQLSALRRWFDDLSARPSVREAA